MLESKPKSQARAAFAVGIPKMKIKKVKLYPFFCKKNMYIIIYLFMYNEVTFVTKIE